MGGTRDITAGSIIPSALGGVAAALVLSYFGAAGSLVGAALGPVVFLVVKELSRGPTEAAVQRAVRVPPTANARAGGAPAVRVGQPPRPRGGLRWLVATAVLATAVAVTAITVPELITGGSLTTDRQTTFFDRGSGGSAPSSAPSGGTTTTQTETTTQTATTTQTETTAPAPAPTDATTTTEPEPQTTTASPTEGVTTTPPPAAAPPPDTAPAVPEATPPVE